MVYRFRIYLLLFILFLSFPVARGQHLHSDSKRALRHFDNAIEQFDRRRNAEALEYLQKAVRADKKFIEAYMMMAQIYKEMQEHDKAIESYQKAMHIEPSFNPEGYLILAEYMFLQGRYEDAVAEVDNFIKLNSFKRTSREEADSLRSVYNFAIELRNHPVPFKPVNLGDSVNSALDEYWPSLSVDEEKLVFTVALYAPDKHPDPRFNYQEDFFYSTKNEDGNWSARKSLGAPVNTSENEGAQSITADGKKLYYTHCRAEIDRGNCNIYFSESRNGRWSIPHPVGPPINTPYKEKQPSVSADDRVLYFSSNRPGGMGGMDIWLSFKNDRGNWSEPVNPGPSVNSKGDEQSPFIHPDGKTLYFSSDGRKGLGGADIYVTVLQEDNTWSEARNIGFPINTNKIEFSLIVNSSGEKAYFATNREEGRGMDIYSFDLYPDVRPVPVSYMKGRVYDAETFRGLDAGFQLIDLESGQLVIDITSEKGSGDYLVPLPTNRDYALNVNRPGYLFYSENFSFKGFHERTDPYLKNVALNPVKEGEKTILRNIFFEFDEWELREESLIELEKIKDFLEKNPGLRVEISGHTDNIGRDEYNKLLSRKRADAVVLYLIDNGIDPDRLESRGYGDDQPIADNSTEQGRAQNRRTEMKIIR